MIQSGIIKHCQYKFIRMSHCSCRFIHGPLQLQKEVPLCCFTRRSTAPKNCHKLHMIHWLHISIMYVHNSRSFIILYIIYRLIFVSICTHMHVHALTHISCIHTYGNSPNGVSDSEIHSIIITVTTIIFINIISWHLMIVISSIHSHVYTERSLIKD